DVDELATGGIVVADHLAGVESTKRSANARPWWDRTDRLPRAGAPGVEADRRSDLELMSDARPHLGSGDRVNRDPVRETKAPDGGELLLNLRDRRGRRRLGRSGVGGPTRAHLWTEPRERRS